MSGSTFDHITDRIETERPFVNFVQLAKEEEERMERRICVCPASCTGKKLRIDREKIDEMETQTSKIGVAKTEVEKSNPGPQLP